MSTLRTGALHFTRADRFQDVFEGALTKPMLDAYRAEYAKHGFKIPYTKQRHRAELAHYAVCCWYLDDHESEAMWNLYAAQGIAIQTTFDRLVHAFPEQTPGKGEEPVYIGQVSYVDYERDALKPIMRDDGTPMWNNAFIPMMHKRKSFQHEREVRAVIHRFSTGADDFDKLSDGSQFRRAAIAEAGEHVPVDLNALVEKVHVSPRMPDWFREVVADAVVRFGYSFGVVQSALAAFPDYDEP